MFIKTIVVKPSAYVRQNVDLTKILCSVLAASSIFKAVSSEKSVDIRDIAGSMASDAYEMKRDVHNLENVFNMGDVDLMDKNA